MANPTERSPLLVPKHVYTSSCGSSSLSSESCSDITTQEVSDADVEGSKQPGADEDLKQSLARQHVAEAISVLLIGIFVAQAAGSMVMATYPLIASEYNDLANASWLVTSYSLAQAATQPLYGKLSDVYGRKSSIIVAYVLFAVGSAIVGVGQSMGQILLGRIISGAGSSGMTVLVSILITDLLPLRDVAQWRSYVNIVATTGRSLGGPLGGWLADAIGWRWSFIGQVPLVLFATILCAVSLPKSTPKAAALGCEDLEPKTRWQQIGRIDFKGSIIFTTMILAFLVPTELGGNHVPWSHPIIALLFAASIGLLFLFIRVEKRADEPIIPLAIFHKRDAVLSYMIVGLQSAAQVGMMFSVPLYFQVTARTSNAEAGAHLFPAVAGNAIGGLLSGALIKRSGRYKTLSVFAMIASCLSYLMLMLRWHGNTNWWESLYIIPGGFGSGVAQSALFIALQVVVDPAHMGPAVSMMYLTNTVAQMTGIVSAHAVMQQFLGSSLRRRLVELGLDAEQRESVFAKAVSDLGYVAKSHGALRAAIVGSYVDGLWYSHGVSLVYSVLGFFGALLLRQRRLDYHA